MELDTAYAGWVSALMCTCPEVITGVVLPEFLLGFRGNSCPYFQNLPESVFTGKLNFIKPTEKGKAIACNQGRG